MTERRFERIENTMSAMHKDMAEIRTDMATLLERLMDYPDVKKDVAGLKRFNAWLIGLGTPSAAGAGILASWFKFGGGQ